MGDMADWMESEALNAEGETMSEQTTNAKTQRVEVKKVYKNEKGPWAMVVTDLDTGNEEKLRFWPTLKGKNGNYNNPAQSAEVGGRYQVALYYQDGKAGYEGEWMVKKCEPLASAQDASHVFHPETKANQSPGFDKADYSMAAHNAWKYAAILEQGFIVSMGHEAYLESGYIGRMQGHANEFAAGILELAKNGPDPLA